MAIYKLHIDESDDVQYDIIAIHTSLEDFRLAYNLNDKLPVLLSRDHSDLQVPGASGSASFCRFVYEDKQQDTTWYLIENKTLIDPAFEDHSGSLFADTSLREALPVYLLPEYKKADYILRIENLLQPVEVIINKINQIDRVSTAYTVGFQQLRSKNNLIF